MILIIGIVVGIMGLLSLIFRDDGDSLGLGICILFISTMIIMFGLILF